MTSSYLRSSVGTLGLSRPSRKLFFFSRGAGAVGRSFFFGLSWAKPAGSDTRSAARADANSIRTRMLHHSMREWEDGETEGIVPDGTGTYTRVWRNLNRKKGGITGTIRPQRISARRGVRRYSWPRGRRWGG